MWSGDKKDGKGTFFYTTKNQRMDGEWLEDICKCGTLSENTDQSEGQREGGEGGKEGGEENESGNWTLPSLTLINPEKVLETQEELVRRMREMRTGTGKVGEDAEEDAEIGVEEEEEGEEDEAFREK
jgi:hypothetical protein